MSNYENKSRDTIHKDLKNEFKSVEHKNGLGFRDDQEIYQAWTNIIDRYLKEIKWDKSNYYWNRSLEPLSICKEELNKKYKLCEWWKLLTENDKLLNDISSDIDNAENEVLRRLLVNKDLRELKQLEQKSKTIYWKEIFAVSNDRIITFNKESNNQQLLDVIQKVFSNKKQSFEIDYSDCKNNKIKEEVKKLTRSEKCWISYNNQLKQFQIITRDKKILKTSPKIREWVKLKTEESIAISESSKELNQDNAEYSEKYREFPANLRKKIEELYWKQWLKKLIEETDKRLDKILKDGINHNYDLHIESVTTPVFRWVAEIHFINKNAEEDVLLWEDWNVLWSHMIQTLVSQKKDYIKYVQKRVSEKWAKLKENSHKHTIDLFEKNPEKALNEKEKAQMLNGIDLLKNYIKNIRKTVWDAKFTWRDTILSEMTSLIESTEYMLWSDVKISKEKLRTNVISVLASKWTSFKIKWFKWIMDGRPKYELQIDSKHAFEKIFFWKTEDDQMIALRSLSDQEAVLDKTESSFLVEKIATKDDLEINNEYVNSILKNLREKLNISENELNFDEKGSVIKNEKIKLIEGLYEASLDWDPKAVANYLCNKWLIPRTHKNNSQLLKWCNEIIQRNCGVIERISNSWKYITSLIDRNKKEIHELKLKTNKTEEEIQRLQALEFMEQNKEFAKGIYQTLTNTIMMHEFYCWMWTSTVNSLRHFFIKFWDWAKWETWKIANDILWVGLFDLTDENAKKLWIVLKEVAILLVTSYIISWALTSLYLKWMNKVSSLLKKVMDAEKVEALCTTLWKWIELSNKFLLGKKANLADWKQWWISKIVRTPIEWIPLNKLKTATFKFSEWSRIRTAIAAWEDVTIWSVVGDWMDIISSGI